MSGDILYFCLMGLGWFFLLGWALALVAACTIAFRQGPPVQSADQDPPQDCTPFP